MKLKTKLPWVIGLTFILYHLCLWIFSVFWPTSDSQAPVLVNSIWLPIVILIFSSVFYVWILVYFRKQKVPFWFSLLSLASILFYAVFFVIKAYLVFKNPGIVLIGDESFFEILEIAGLSNFQMVLVMRLAGYSGFLIFIAFMYVFIASLKAEFPKFIYLACLGLMAYNYLFLTFTSFLATLSLYSFGTQPLIFVEFSWYYFLAGGLMTLIQIYFVKALQKKEISDKIRKDEFMEIERIYQLSQTVLKMNEKKRHNS
jgi:hypothetical protein